GAKLDAKLLDRVFHWRRQISPPIDNAAHRFFHGLQHFLYRNVTVGSCHGAIASSSLRSAPSEGSKVQTAKRDLQELVHHKCVDVTIPRMSDRRRQAADDLESERLPQPHGALIGTDHKVELHRAIPTQSSMR